MTQGMRQSRGRQSLPAAPSALVIALTGALVIALIGALAMGAAACGDDKASTQDRKQPDPLAALQGEIIEQKSELGPVSAVVKVGPKSPTLGDPITLFLEVTAEPGVTVEMPDFGEALGRFSIARFVPRENIVAGKRVATQIYTLQTPMSGKQRIPPLRIEFIDERTRPAADPGTNPDPAAAPASDPDSAPNANPTGNTTGSQTEEPGEIRELLTEEIPIQIASLLAEDLAKAELAGPRGSLRVPSPADSLLASPWFWIPVALVLGLILFFVTNKLLAQARKQRRISAYAAAIKRLGKLEGRGLPEPEQADNWYVELSSIIRRYLEDRYSLRAPELTTEEFLKIARSSGVLSTEHRKLLQTFLTRCDRVKFARYAPEDDESREALDSAKSFLEDTRPEAQAVQQAAEQQGQQGKQGRDQAPDQTPGQTNRGAAA